MSRRLIVWGLGLVIASSASAVQAQGDPTPMPSVDPLVDTPAPPASEPDEPDSAIDSAAGNQELGATIGLAVGGHISPGGLNLAGAYLYRLSDVDWFEAGLGFSFGGGDAACFRDRQDEFKCTHSSLDGFSTDLMLGVRRFFGGQGEFRPYAHGGVAGRLASYSADDVLGVGVAGWIGGGVRARVADGVSVGGGARMLIGPGWFDHGLGIEPQFSLAVTAGVDFQLD